MTYILITFIICIAIFTKMALVIIPQSETKIIERLGRYHATLNPGVNMIIPLIDRSKSIVILQNGHYVNSDRIDLREQVYDFPKQNVITKDNVQTEINALLYFQIVDPFKAIYEISNLPNAIEKLTQTTLRNIIGELELDETLTSSSVSPCFLGLSGLATLQKSPVVSLPYSLWQWRQTLQGTQDAFAIVFFFHRLRS